MDLVFFLGKIWFPANGDFSHFLTENPYEDIMEILPLCSNIICLELIYNSKHFKFCVGWKFTVLNKIWIENLVHFDAVKHFKKTKNLLLIYN